MAQFNKDHRKAREESRKRNELDTAIMDVWRRHNDRVEHRKKKVLKEVRPVKSSQYLLNCRQNKIKEKEKWEMLYKSNDFTSIYVVCEFN